MKIELDKKKTDYFNQILKSQVNEDLEAIVNNIFRSYLEQMGQRASKSYSQWLEEQMET